MICNGCGSDFNAENFDKCPYCLTPIKSLAIIKEDLPPIDDEDLSIDEAESSVKAIENSPAAGAKEDLPIDEAEFSIKAAESSPVAGAKEDLPVDRLGLSKRAENALRRTDIHTLSMLIEYYASHNMSNIKNIGAKTVQEIDELMDKIGKGSFSAMKSSGENFIDVPVFKKMSPDLTGLDISALKELGLPNGAVSALIFHGFHRCKELCCLSQTAIIKIIGVDYKDYLPSVAEMLEKDIISLLTAILDNHNDSREFNIYVRRAKGETLQEIADNPPAKKECKPITRERVRQIEGRYEKSIIPFIKELFLILKGRNSYVPAQDLLDVFDNEEYDQVLLYACKTFGGFEYLDFADLFVEKPEDGSLEQRLLGIIVDIVKDGIDLAENREIIEDALTNNKLDFISFDDIVNLLKKYNYRIYSGFAVKGNSRYAPVCRYIIRKFFPNGIKLTQNDEEYSEDLTRLRKIIDDKYKGIALPESNRALSSMIARNGLILKGRGLYISQEHISPDESLIMEIKEYIDAKDSDKIFYNEIYAHFEGPLNMLCGIDNYNYLHGVLAMVYPEEYKYERDYLLKNGATKSQTASISDRIYKYICDVGRPVNKTELSNHFKGFSDVMLFMPFVNDSRLMQWEYNFYSCSGIIDITDYDIMTIRNCIMELFGENNGYASDGMLFERLMKTNKEFIEKNHIQSEMNLHYIAAKQFAEEMDFKRPHIGEKGKFDLSSKNVVLHLLGNPDSFTYEQYMNICERMKWARVTMSMILYDIEEDYARVSLDRYIKKSKFAVPDNILSAILRLIQENAEDGILPLTSLDFDDFPEWEFEWNEFIIETIIKRYFDKFVIVQPDNRDRRYQRGIIVAKEKGITSYPQIVANKMLAIGKDKMTESEFLSFLTIHSLALKAIPSELAKSDYIIKIKDGDYYYTVSK